MKVKTSELTGTALRWAVAAAKGLKILDVWPRPYGESYDGDWYLDKEAKKICRRCFDEEYDTYEPDLNWAQGGPIIDHHIVELVKGQSDGVVRWEARAGFEFEPGHAIQYGPTPLIAAMRCFVASKLGDEVDVPEELL